MTHEQHDIDARLRAHGPAPGRRRPPEPASDSLPMAHLQSIAGNRAVTGLVQRYASGEHAKQGDHAPDSHRVTIGTEVLTSGEINALADLYGTPDDLLRADPKEVSAAVALVRREASGAGVREDEWDTATGGRYTRLNLKNSAHFSPRDPAIIAPVAGAPATGQDNQSTFLTYYADTVTTTFQSVDLATTDPVKSKELADRATVTAGFAEHYLMDAFSAGHLLNKDDFVATFKANLDALAPAKLSGLFGSIARGVLADGTSKALLDQYETVDRHYGFHPNFSRDAAFQGLLEELYKDPDGRQAVYSGLVKFVHDDLSTHPAGGGLVGIEVHNAFETWVLSGDKTLAKSPDTQRIIDQALHRFRHLMEDYRAAPRSLVSPTVDAAQVTDLFPHPTPASTATISALVTKITDPSSGAVASLVSILQAELPAILSALLARGKIRKA